MNDSDRRIIALSRATAVRYLSNVKRFTKRLFRRPATASTPAADADNAIQAQKAEARKQAITQFILALSDQQLVTGLAILVSGVANRKTLTLYEFSVVLSLAWFSATTHLATMDALRTYLKKRRAIRNARVIGIVAVLGFLVFAFAVTIKSSILPNTVPVLCVLDSGLQPRVDQWRILSGVGVLVLLFYEYSTRIWHLYFDYSSVVRLMAWPSRHLLRKKSTWRLLALELSPDEIQAVLKADIRRYRARMASASSRISRGLMLMTCCFETFFFSFAGLGFSFAFAVSQLISNRWGDAPPLDENTDDMGFGQIMALFLLALPFLAAGECYYGTHLVLATLV